MLARILTALLCDCVLLTVRAQDPLQLLPRNYAVVFENEAVRVVKVLYQPHEKLPVHDHARTPTVYVYLSDSGPVRFSHAEESPFSLVRRPLKAGTFRISPGRIERHSVENLSDMPSEFLRVELKTIPLGNDSIAYRGNKPFDLTKTGVTTEFDSKVLRVDRIVIAANSPGQHCSGTASSLVVAFTPAVVGGRHMKEDGVLWAAPSFDVQPAAAAPVHLLRITPR